ncbi:DUF3515 domain-containing protein [Microbacterium resistens]|uniref:DUF3515 domain-containing protein n=1 Tax=Microbacterium resistens TaxID=156977 RepID=A0ABY3RV41_9MICO|nr:hypothetical protein [Microbacterium resistens]MBW1637928.1 DUF3515 domain-containing protein [Microbacterium resistens]UGS27741.1 DUF3515 domain-containing protein [Microbacterium resistens]
MPRRLLAALLTVVGGAAVLTGCSSTVHLEPAEAANDPACAEVSVRLQNVPSIGEQERRWTDAQATAAWGVPGQPSAVLLVCGLPKAQPTSELQCVTAEGIDWLVDVSERPWLRLTTYGREPAVQLYVNTKPDEPNKGLSANDVVGNKSLAAAIGTIPAENRCTEPDALQDDAQG